MRIRGVTVVALVVLLAGCRSRTETAYSSYDHYSNWSERTYSTSPSRTSRDRPRIALSDAEIEAALANHRTQEAQRREALAQVSVDAPDPSAPPLTDVDAELQVRSCYQIGARDAAEVVIARHPSVYTWDQAQDVIEISAVFERGSPRSTLAVSMTRKPGVEGELVIAIPPGTFAMPVGGLARRPGEAKKAGEGARPRRWTTPDQQRRFQHWPPAQDLALLRAPVVRLSGDRQTVVTRIPVACASFRIGAPKHNQPMALDRFEPDTKIDRLMIALCSGPAAPSSEAQLAVWLARDDLAWNEFVAKGGRYGGLITFDRQRVLPHHGSGASLLLLEAGIDPRTQSKFYEVVTPPSPSAAPELDPQAWPEFDEPDGPPLTPAEPTPTTIG